MFVKKKIVTKLLSLYTLFTSRNNATNYLNSLPNKESHKILNLKQAKEISKQLFEINNLS